MNSLFTSNANSATPGSLVYVWSPQGSLGRLTTTIAPSGWTVVNPMRLGASDYYGPTYLQGIMVPANASPGQYTVTFAGPTAGEVVIPTPPPAPPLTITVVAPPVLVPLTYSGFNHVMSPITLHNNVIDGQYQTVFLADTYAVNHNNPVFTPTGNFYIRRCSFYGNNYNNYIFHQYPQINGSFLIEDCYFKNCIIGSFSLGEVTFRNCTFDQCTGTSWLSGSFVYDNCVFKGSTGYECDAFLIQGANQGLIVNCDWQFTNRGIHIGTNQAPVSNLLIASCKMISIGPGENGGGESIVWETNPWPITNVTVYGIFMNGCSGPGIELVAANPGAPIQNCNFFNLQLDSKIYSILLNGYKDAIQNNYFTNVELSSELYLIGNCNGNVFNNIWSRQQARGAGNHFPYAGTYLTGNRVQDKSTGPNTITNVVNVTSGG